MDHAELVDTEAIRRLRYRYVRCLDGKDWDGVAECLTPAATSAFSGGARAHQGRDAIIEFLRGALGPDHMVSWHLSGHDEIEFLDDARTAARGRWVGMDRVLDLNSSKVRCGFSAINEEYERVDGRWWIRHTGWVRSIEEEYTVSDAPLAGSTWYLGLPR